MVETSEQPQYLKALQAFQAGDLNDSRKILEQIERQGTMDAFCWQLRAIIAIKSGNAEAAGQYMRKCLESSPEEAGILLNLARYYLQHRQIRLAHELFRRVISQDPSQYEAWLYLGRIENDLGRLDEARRSLQQARTLKPNLPEPWFCLGVVSQKAQSHDKAEACFKKVVSIQPDHVRAWTQLGILAHVNGKPEAAVQYFATALKIAPDQPQLLEYQAKSLAQVNRYDESAVLFRKILSNNPGHLEALLGLSALMLKQRRFKTCGSLLKEARYRYPHDERVLTKTTSLWNSLGRHADAESLARPLLRNDPDNINLLNLLGSSLWQQGEYQSALEQFEAALTRVPESAESHFNRGFMLLLLGNYEEGWSEYEWRLPYFKPRSYTGFPPRKRWRGESLKGKTLLVCQEQGMGDFFMFARYLQLLCAQAEQILLMGQKEAIAFFEHDKAVRGIAFGGQCPEYDYHVPMPSLPCVFGSTMENIPAQFPYLSVETGLREKLQSVVGNGDELKAGIVWSGNPANPIDGRRSCTFSDFKPLLSLDHIRFFSLQVGEPSMQLDDPRVIDTGKHLADYRHTAALISLLDLVIGVDTSVIHLSGALGKPLYVALPSVPPDWRWLLDRPDSPWYPSATLFRQSDPGKWGAVFREIREKLNKIKRV